MEDVARDAAGEPDATDVVQRVHKTMDKIDRMAGVASSNGSGTQNNATWNVNAGGAGLWACVTCCLLMLVISIGLMFAYLDVRDEQRVTAAHQATLYMLMPEVRKLVNEHMKNPQEKEEEK